MKSKRYVPITIVGICGSVRTETEDGSGTVLIPPILTLTLDSRVDHYIISYEIVYRSLQADVCEILRLGLRTFNAFHALSRDTHLVAYCQGR